MQVSAATFGQRLTLKQNNVTMDQVFREIRKQTGYDVLMNITRYKNTTINANFQNTPLEEVMDQLTKNKDLEYTIEDKTVVIKEKEPSFLDKVTAYFASISVRGAVVDENGQPMAGVTVSVKNGKATVSTDSYGGYYLKNVDENAVLIFSFLGYVSQEISVDGKDGLGVIKMKLSESKLDEVQIQAYGKTSKRLSTSNITTVKAEDLAKQPVDNPLYALMGRVPGLTITQISGMPNAPVKVQLRGQNSLSTVESEPLYVIDGVPFLNNMTGPLLSQFYGPTTENLMPNGIKISALATLNPNDIESIDVLKDADATAIYGSRGANGVILITTKKGKLGETKITGTISSSFSYVGKKYELMNTQEYLQMRKQAYINDGLPIPDPSIPGSQKNSTNFDLTVWDQNRYTDWQDVLLGATAASYNASASIAGGSPTIQYSVTGNYANQGSVFPGNAKSINGSGRVTVSGSSPDNRFSTNLTASYVGASNSTPRDFSQLAFTLAPNAPALYNINGDLNWEPNPGSSRGEGTWTNPYSRLLQNVEMNTDNFQASANANYEIIPSLNFRIQGGLTRTNFHSFTPTPISSYDPVVQSTRTGTVILNDNNANTWSIEPQLNYSKRVLKGKMDLLVGGSYQGDDRGQQNLYQGNYSSDALLKSLSFGNTLISGSSSSEYRYTALFGRLNYNWDDRYIVNFTGRRDGSSRFGPGHQFGNFGSAGLAWLFTNEKFLKNQSILSFGKLRASYGTNGNDAIGDYQFLQLISAQAGKYQNQNLLTPTGQINPNYHWESKRSLEIGLDIGLFKDRISLSTSMFKSISGNQLVPIDLPATAGPSGIYLANDARVKIQNTGAELSLNSTNVVSKSFRWSTSANISFLNRNKIIDGAAGDLPARLKNIYGDDNRYKNLNDLIGKPFAGIVAVYEYRGIDPKTGLYQFTTYDGSVSSDVLGGEINKFAKIIDISPKYYGGISNQFSYNGISLDLFLQFAKQVGRSPLYQNTSGLPGRANLNLPIEFLDYWLPGKDSKLQKVSSGQDFSSSFPASNTNAAINASDVAWVDASFLRVKNIAISYQFSQSFVSRLHMKNLKIGVNAQNLFTITGYKGLDPESQSVLSLPPLRTIAFNLQVGL